MPKQLTLTQVLLSYTKESSTINVRINNYYFKAFNSYEDTWMLTRTSGFRDECRKNIGTFSADGPAAAIDSAVKLALDYVTRLSGI